jgi:hypothetical protein
VEAFFRGVLNDGAVAVAELEARARAAGLLGEMQRVTDAKVFKRAKKEVGITSRRDGFGRGGEWFWALPTVPKTKAIETAVPRLPASVIYACHSRPEQLDQVPALRPDDDRHADPVVSEWIRCISGLDYRQPPRDVPLHRWQQLVNDCENFVFSHEKWAARTAEIGWTTETLFGCSASRPLDHLRGAGLLWHLVGGRLKQLHKDWAVIEAADGTERVFHRRPATIHCTLPWRLR